MNAHGQAALHLSSRNLTYEVQHNEKIIVTAPAAAAQTEQQDNPQFYAKQDQ